MTDTLTDTTDTVTPADDSGILPPYSGEQTACVKCGNPEAHTVYRPAQTIMSLDEFNGRVRRGPLPERLERQCRRCDFQWDEALVVLTAGMTADALAHALDNSTPYPLELHRDILTFMAGRLLDMLHVTARPDHPLWQYDAGQPRPTIKPQLAPEPADSTEGSP